MGLFCLLVETSTFFYKFGVVSQISNATFLALIAAKHLYLKVLHTVCVLQIAFGNKSVEEDSSSYSALLDFSDLSHLFSKL